MSNIKQLDSPEELREWCGSLLRETRSVIVGKSMMDLAKAAQLVGLQKQSSLRSWCNSTGANIILVSDYRQVAGLEFDSAALYQVHRWDDSQIQQEMETFLLSRMGRIIGQ